MRKSREARRVVEECLQLRKHISVNDLWMKLTGVN